MSRQLGSIASASLAGLPDAVTAGVFLFAWIYPRSHPELPAMLLLVMLIEFLAVHSAGMMGTLALRREMPVENRLRGLLGLGLMYALFAAGFAIGFESWWPVWWLLWLLGSKLALAVGPAPSRSIASMMNTIWGLSVACYVVLAGLTTFLPIPRLGIDAAARRAMDIPGSGLWVDEPWRVIAFGFTYFSILAVSRYALRRSNPASAGRRSLEPGPDVAE